jgi:hypothetical protein
MSNLRSVYLNAVPLATAISSTNPQPQSITLANVINPVNLASITHSTSNEHKLREENDAIRVALLDVIHNSRKLAEMSASSEKKLQEQLKDANATTARINGINSPAEAAQEIEKLRTQINDLQREVWRQITPNTIVITQTPFVQVAREEAVQINQEFERIIKKYTAIQMTANAALRLANQKLVADLDVVINANQLLISRVESLNQQVLHNIQQLQDFKAQAESATTELHKKNLQDFCDSEKDKAEIRVQAQEALNQCNQQWQAKFTAFEQENTQAAAALQQQFVVNLAHNNSTLAYAGQMINDITEKNNKIAELNAEITSLKAANSANSNPTDSTTSAVKLRRITQATALKEALATNSRLEREKAELQQQLKQKQAIIDSIKANQSQASNQVGQPVNGKRKNPTPTDPNASSSKKPNTATSSPIFSGASTRTPTFYQRHPPAQTPALSLEPNAAASASCSSSSVCL